jgi:hypothetical protein
MSLPIQVQSRLYHFKNQMLGLVAAHVFSVVMVSRLFGISRNTFYKYRHQAEQGRLASFDCTPHVHGSAKPQREQGDAGDYGATPVQWPESCTCHSNPEKLPYACQTSARPVQ